MIVLLTVFPDPAPAPVPANPSDVVTAPAPPRVKTLIVDVDAAVTSCTDEAQQIGGVAGTALSGACTSVGAAATQAVATAGDNAQQALSQAASSCKSSVGQVPKGQAQDALTQLCDAIAAAGSG